MMQVRRFWQEGPSADAVKLIRGMVSPSARKPESSCSG